MDDNCSNPFNAHQDIFGPQWLNVVPCKNLCLILDDQKLRISIGLRLGANICVAHTCQCTVVSVERGVYMVFLEPRVLVASHVMLRLNLSLGGRWDLSTCLQCSSRLDCTELMANAQTVLLSFLENGLTAAVACHSCGCSYTQSPESRLLMQPWNLRHRG